MPSERFKVGGFDVDGITIQTPHGPVQVVADPMATPGGFELNPRDWTCEARRYEIKLEVACSDRGPVCDAGVYCPSWCWPHTLPTFLEDARWIGAMWCYEPASSGPVCDPLPPEPPLGVIWYDPEIISPEDLARLADVGPSWLVRASEAPIPTFFGGHVACVAILDPEAELTTEGKRE